MGGPVHQRWGRERPQPAVFGGGDDLVDRIEVGSVLAPKSERGDHEVGLTPQHPFGQSRRAAGVTHVQIVARALIREAGSQRLRGGLGHHVFVPPGPVDQIVAGFVRHLNERFEMFQPGAHLLHEWGEGRVEHQDAGTTVGKDVGELCGEVPIVDVDGCPRCLPGAEHRFEVLVSVVQVQRDVFLGAFPSVGTLEHPAAAGAHPVERLGEGRCSGIDLCPTQPPVAKQQCVTIRVGLRDRCAHVGDVQLHVSSTSAPGLFHGDGRSDRKAAGPLQPAGLGT